MATGNTQPVRSKKARALTEPTLTLRTLAPIDRALWLPPGIVLRDAVAGRAYRVLRFLGRGGFGAAYEAQPLSAAIHSAPARCVLKVTLDVTAWHREAYFGHLFRRVPALVEVYGSFACVPRPGRAPFYCLVSERVEHGDLGHYLRRSPEPWPEGRARREIIRLLRAVTRIHESGAVHRDITPSNVFVASDRALKLGDFGIALHRAGQRYVAADAFAPRFAPAPFAAEPNPGAPPMTSTRSASCMPRSSPESDRARSRPPR